VKPDAATAPQAQHAPQAAAPTQEQQGPAPVHSDSSPVAVAPVVEQAVPAVTTQVETVTSTVTGTVNDVQAQLPVRTPQILRKR
jgi:hypothetical protein